jgi:ribose 5-phosphate isomerase B
LVSLVGVRIAVGSDMDLPVVAAVADHLSGAGFEVVETLVGEPWPETGRAVGEAVAAGRADLGVVCCWTGTGVCMAANKVPGVRAALCHDAPTASGARRWNDANVLALSLRTTTEALAAEILDAFVAGRPDPDEQPTIARLELAGRPGRGG